MATVKHVTSRQMSPPPSAAACEMAGSALRGGEGPGQHRPAGDSAAAEQGLQHWPLGPVGTGRGWPLGGHWRTDQHISGP